MKGGFLEHGFIHRDDGGGIKCVHDVLRFNARIVLVPVDVACLLNEHERQVGTDSPPNSYTGLLSFGASTYELSGVDCGLKTKHPKE